MGVPEAVALEIPAVEEGSPTPLARVPPRIRRRLLRAWGSGENGGKAPTTEEIEAKLRQAHLRRQQFHEALSSKARRSIKSPSGSSQEEDRGQLLEAKLVAAKQKRLSLLEKEQSRLAKLDKQRHAVKSDAELRFEREREELGMKVESRVQKAENNRMQLLHARLQRRAALEERTKRYFMQRLTWENKYRERVRSAIQKCNAAEKRRLGLLESEKKRAQGRLLQVQLAAKTASNQRETERSKLKEQLEEKLQKAKQQRAEYLKQRGNPHSSMHSSSVKNGEFLSRKLAKCWRRLRTSRKTTVVLARAFDALGINQRSVVSMPFEELALCIESPAVLQTTKALLDCLESRFAFPQSSSSSEPENIDHLLKHLGSPKRRFLPSNVGRSKATMKKAVGNYDSSKLSRYSQRIALCAYMILGHPKSVLSGQDGACILSPSVLDDATPGCSSYDESSCIVADLKKFRTQLVAFDKAWCAYLCHFVAWKAKDAKSLEDDLIRAACKLELSMIQTCKTTNEGESDNLGGDLKAIRKQVAEDQKLLRERIQHLGSEAGYESSKGGKLMSNAAPEKMPTENEQIVNEILHDIHGSFADISDGTGTVESDFKVKVKETMEKAFWDAVADSMRGDMPDYGYLALKAEVSRARIQLLEPMIKGPGGVEYLQKSFADRYGSPCDALASLPSTARWISSLKDVVEEQWNEHVQPLVATLRTGHSVPGQLQSVIPAADNAGLPECRGEILGKLIRIGLLQLISSMEGVQRESVPETFMINWLRLRSVQSRFQRVIVIATSMLVLHQVLVSENPKITPHKLENVSLELFNVLTRLLDNFPDVGTEKIIEAMIYSSTSRSSSSDHEMMDSRNRKEILTRVFLKSLQTDDTIFKKVSVCVLCIPCNHSARQWGEGPEARRCIPEAHPGNKTHCTASEGS
ncbi:unnamed protein product [Miscanthus lutarioriparius]|uniref:T-complex protein 11 n=1 Tax=Miscanthus lutarioriparius TaxID=422564 RepID=A0A811PLY6_9POAL|nr:unnamed protein product [Miscanthus lutarioriparius]